jgi:hypothetical protein
MTRTYKLVSRFLGAGALAATLLAAPAIARADRCSDQQAAANKGGRKNYKTVIRNGRKIFVIQKAFVVCGKVPKPNVIYVLQASTINYEWETLKRDFLPKITGAVKKDPF